MAVGRAVGMPGAGAQLGCEHGSRAPGRMTEQLVLPHSSFVIGALTLPFLMFSHSFNQCVRISPSCFLFDLNYQVLLCRRWACEVKTEAVSLHSSRQNERRPSSTQGQKLTVYRGSVVCPALSQVPSTQQTVWGVSLRSLMTVLFPPFAGEGQEMRKAEWQVHCQDSNPGLSDSGPHTPIIKRLPLCCEGSPALGWGQGRKGSPGAGHRLEETS